MIKGFFSLKKQCLMNKTVTLADLSLAWPTSPSDCELRGLPSDSDNMIWLVVSIPLKNMKVSWHYYSQYMEKYKPSSKPSTSDTKMIYPLVN